MPKHVKSEGIDSFLSVIEEHKDKEEVFVLFCGGKDESGQSWCPDCVDGRFCNKNISTWTN